MSHWVNSRANFVPADDKGDLATPGVNEAGPAGVNGDVFAVSRQKTNRRVVKRLTGILQDCCKQKVKCKGGKDRSNINLLCASSK